MRALPPLPVTMAILAAVDRDVGGYAADGLDGDQADRVAEQIRRAARGARDAGDRHRGAAEVDDESVAGYFDVYSLGLLCSI